MLNLKYFEKLIALRNAEAPAVNFGIPQPQWLTSHSGIRGARLAVVINAQGRRIEVELVMEAADMDCLFDSLSRQRECIERELGFELEWNRGSDVGPRKVVAYLPNSTPSEYDDWDRQHRWVLKKLQELKDKFSEKINVIRRV